MARDHFLPASIIGRFGSADSVGPYRERVVTCLRRASPQPVLYQSAAKNLGFENSLYDVDGPLGDELGRDLVDREWKRYEARLPAVLDALLAREMTGEEWIDILVPYVASLFVRDRTFAERVAWRVANGLTPTVGIEGDGLQLSRSNVNINRLVERENFYAKVLTSEWVLHVTEAPVALPDLGFVFDNPAEHPLGDAVGLFAPLDPHLVLELRPAEDHAVLYRAEGRWRPALLTMNSPLDVEKFNFFAWDSAQRFMVGDEASLALVLSTADAPEHIEFPAKHLDELLHLWPSPNQSSEMAGVMDAVRTAVIDGSPEVWDVGAARRFLTVESIDGVDWMFINPHAV